MNAYLEQFIKEKFSKPGKALDLGAGKFFDVACLKKLGWQAFGVDLATGTDLEKPYLSSKKPFNLVYSNYVIHKLKNPEQLIKTAYQNLKNNGWVFIHAFDKSDKNSTSKISKKQLCTGLAKTGFVDIQCKLFNFYDNDPGHKHWHKILQASGRKP